MSEQTLEIPDNLDALVDEALEDVTPVEGATKAIDEAPVKGEFETIDLSKTETKTEDSVEKEEQSPETKTEEKSTDDSEKTDVEIEDDWIQKLKSEVSGKSELKEQKPVVDENQIKIQNLEKRLEEIQKKSSSDNELKFTPEQVFLTMARIKSGDAEDSHQLRMEIRGEINKMSPDDLDKVVEMADNGYFGEHSEEVANIVNREYRSVERKYAKARESEKTQAEWQGNRDAASKKVLAALGNDAGLLKEFGDAAVEVQQYIPDLPKLANAPELVFKHMEYRSKAGLYNNASKEAARLKKENENLKKRLSVLESPSSGAGSITSGTASSSRPADRELRSAENELAAAVKNWNF